MLFAASTQPRNTIALKPMIAVPAAASHMRMRVQSPVMTRSLMAPIVQK